MTTPRLLDDANRRAVANTGSSDMPAWRFPPRHGGIEYLDDPAGLHFSDVPLVKLVREVIQNALDAKHGGYDTPVSVIFEEIGVDSQLIGAMSLEPHLRACRERAVAEKPELVDLYTNALSIIRMPEIRSLRIWDRGTVGLDDSRWKALVLQEGAVRKVGNAAGGSYGIGKNATIGVSDLRTAFYSTRLVEGRKGLVTRLQGKSTLSAHADPSGSGDDLQHIGYYVGPDDGPITGKDIPELFRLAETGTGVFVAGFNPRCDDWAMKASVAVIENFFYAIHRNKLVVEITAEGHDPVRIDSQTIGYLVERCSEDVVHYYRAINRCHTSEDRVLSDELDQLGRLAVHITFASGAPRRVAHVNRNGMLITDSREQKVNPLAPRGRSLWPDFACVVTPDSEAGDQWLRRMENPSHDGLSVGHLWEEGARSDATDVLRHARRRVREIIDLKAGIGAYGESSNLDELAGLLPDRDGPDTRPLTARIVGTYSASSDQHTSEENVPAGNVASHPPDEAAVDPRTARGQEGARPSWPRCARYIPLSPSAAVIAFDPPSNRGGELRLALAPAGMDRDPRGVRRVTITEATSVGEVETPVTVSGGMVVLGAVPDRRVAILVRSDGDLGGQAFRFV